MKADERICGNCRYWQIDMDAPMQEAMFGQCRRHAPRWLSKEANAWPVTGEHAWCGEHLEAGDA